MDQFPSNSHRGPQREEPKKHATVVTGEVIVRKKTMGKRFYETLFGGDAQGVVGYVLMDVLVPAIKDVIVDAVSTGVERMIFGGEHRSPSRRGGYRPSSSPGYTQYNRYATPHPSVRREEPREQRRMRSGHYELDDIILATRAEAEMVIDRMFDIVNQYEQVSVGDVLEMVGRTGNFVDQKWGWTDLRGAAAVRVRDGYLLDLPRAEPLKS